MVGFSRQVHTSLDAVLNNLGVGNKTKHGKYYDGNKLFHFSFVFNDSNASQGKHPLPAWDDLYRTIVILNSPFLVVSNDNPSATWIDFWQG